MDKNETYRQGMAAYNAGDYPGAICRLEALAGQAGATGLLSRFYLGQAHHELAIDHFRHMRFKEAATHFETAAGLNPMGGGVERFLAACYVKTGRFDLAVEHLRQLVETCPEDSDTRIRLALTQWRNASPLEALATLRDGISRYPDTAELHYQLGALHAARDEIEQAEACFSRTLECDPRHVSALERLAQCCGVRGDSRKAAELLHQAHAIDPRNARVAFQLTVLAQCGGPAGRTVSLASQGDCVRNLDQAAIERLGEIIVGEPDFLSAFLSLPASDVDREVFSALAVTLEHALETHPEYADLHYHCGAVYRRLGRSKAAVEHAERAVRINPRFVDGLILLGELYSQTERVADSVERLEEAIREGGDYPDVHQMLGRLYQRTGQLSRAKEAFQRALTLNRNYQPAREALVALQSE